MNILIFVINNVFINIKKNIKFNIIKTREFLTTNLFIFTRIKRRKIISIFNIDCDIIENILINTLSNNYINNIVNFLLFLFNDNINIIDF